MLFAKDKGAQIEQHVSAYLKRQGLVLRQQNYHCRFGEIDLVMEEGDIIVFVEVRFRANASYGTALESITRTKQQKIIKTASHYLQQHQLSSRPCRFDAVGVTETAKQLDIHWIQHAFEQN
jgi:putative endonuclease